MTQPKKKAKPGNSRSVVKSNRLNTAIHNLSLDEFRLIQLAIIEARESGAGFSEDTPLRLRALHYARTFNLDREHSYQTLRMASQSLVRRTFVFVDRTDGNPVESNWLLHVKYLKGEGAVELVFTPMVARHIYRLEGEVTPFTQYALKQTAPLRNIASIRLYELILQWVKQGSTPEFDLLTFRRQLEVGDDLYTRFSNFRTRVFEPAMAQVLKHTDIEASYKFVRQGRTITGISFFDIKRMKAVDDLDEQPVVAEQIESGVENDDSVVATVPAGEAVPSGTSLPLELVVVEKEPAAATTVLSTKQAEMFGRRLVNNPSSSWLIPQTCSTARDAVVYVVRLLQTDPDFVRKAAKDLRRLGFSGAL